MYIEIELISKEYETRNCAEKVELKNLMRFWSKCCYFVATLFGLIADNRVLNTFSLMSTTIEKNRIQSLEFSLLKYRFNDTVRSTIPLSFLADSQKYLYRLFTIKSSVVFSC